jgi:hypothetical protein
MSRFHLKNALGLSLRRVSVTGVAYTLEPPEHVDDGETGQWISNEAGAVTYGVESRSATEEPGKQFTLTWDFASPGELRAHTRNVSRGVRIQVTEGPTGTLFTVSPRRATIIPLPRHLAAALVPAVTALLILTLAAAGVGASLAAGHGWPPGRSTKPTAPVSVVTTTTLSAAALVVNPAQGGTVECSAPSVAYPAITLSNRGDQPLQWQAAATGAGAMITPGSGTLDAGMSQTLSLQQKGGVTTAASVSITSNGGNASLTFSCATSHGTTTTNPPPPPPGHGTTTTNPPPPPPGHGNLLVTPTALALGSFCGDTFSGAGLTLSNTGDGFLTWQPPSGGGITLLPAGGQLNGHTSIPVSVSGTKSNTSFSITWLDRGQGSPQTQSVSLSCTPKVVNFSISPSSASWDCTKQGTYVPSITLTLNNTGSNVAVGWQITAREAPDLLNPNPNNIRWAYFNLAGGTVPAGSTAQVTITPYYWSSSDNLCIWTDSFYYHADVTLTSGGSGVFTFTYFIGHTIF